jgi:class 3 adenylate cyclase
MLVAIGQLAGTAPATSEPAARIEPKSQDTAERRQVTVMFCDLVGSTALSARMDPEDLREVISFYQTCVAETVSHFGGFVAKYTGDGVLVAARAEELPTSAGSRSPAASEVLGATRRNEPCASLA